MIDLFEVRSRVELGDLIGVSSATLSTWTTRETTPHELLIRIHLLTGWPMEYLCFGVGDLSKIKGKTNAHFSEQVNEVAPPTLSYERSVLQVYTIDNGHLAPYEKIEATVNLLQYCKVRGNENDLVVKDGFDLLFINTREIQVNQGRYLYKVNQTHQLGMMKLYPDGKIYLLEEEERYLVDESVTQIVGKVAATLKQTPISLIRPRGYKVRT
ncbi:helix-turn-helix domain-containing protein [Shewanella basaltis]|uniref:helix-turn-helix domain-containing protein n=1 Tax=Shewanella basaltis TaxID=472183 RepID=UPI003AAF3C92